jgi:hypothetical protein
MEMHQNEGHVNVSVANLYRDAAYGSEVISQALLGETIIVLKKEKNFSRVQLPDGYQGWISNFQWVANQDIKLDTKRVRSHLLGIYENPLSNARCGDLYFFSDDGSKISHVGIVSDSNRMIHARGMVRHNSLIRSDEDFCEDLQNTFVDVRTLF